LNVRCQVAGEGSALGLRSAGAVAGVEVEFVGADGVVRLEPLSGCWDVAFERAAPVRGFASFRGSATARVCGGSPLRGSTWGMSPGWSGIG
jgi:hypothetical protein